LYKEALEASGVISVTLKFTDWPSYSANRNNEIMDAYVYGWYPDYVDPDDYAFLYWASWLHTNYSNATQVGYYDEARATTNTTLRAELYGNIDEIAVKECSVVPLWVSGAWAVTKPSIYSIYLDITQDMRYWLLYVTEIDSTPPTIYIQSPENKTYAVNASIPLMFTVDELTSWMGYSLNGQPNATITENTTLSTLPDGWYDLTVYANDTFGNMGSATVYFTVDTTKPDITNVVQDPLTNILPDTVVKINATVTDATSRVKQVLLNCTFTNSTNTWYAIYGMANLIGDFWNATIPQNPNGTNVTYVIIAEDNAGNTINTEQIYGYKYEYPVVPEFPMSTILLAFIITTLSAVIIYKRKHL
jgi:hypothetical protein